MSKKSYIIADDGVIIPFCQRCGKPTNFYPAEAPHSTGCFCTNPIITKIARNLQNKRLRTKDRKV